MNNVFKLPKGKTIEMVEMYDLKVRLFPREKESLTCTYVVGLPTWSQPQLTQRCTCTCVHTGLAAHALRGARGAGHGQGLGAEGPQLLQPPRGHRQVRPSAFVFAFAVAFLEGVLAAGVVRTMAQPNPIPSYPTKQPRPPLQAHRGPLPEHLPGAHPQDRAPRQPPVRRRVAPPGALRCFACAE